MGKSSKRDPLAVLRGVLCGEDWVALDVETSDLGPRAELVEIAIVDPAGGEVSTLVRPRGGIAERAARVHRIPPEDIAAAPSFADVAAAIRQRLAKRTVLGYHVDFDRRVLWRESQANGEFDMLAELRGAVDTVRSHLLSDAIVTLDTAGSVTEPDLRCRFTERQGWLAAAEE